MKQRDIDFSDLEEQDWIIILFALFMDDMNAKDKAWSEFQHELVYENRFSSSHAIIKEICNKKAEAEYILKEDSILYRARIFRQSQFMNLAAFYLEKSGVPKKAVQRHLKSINDWEKYFELLPSMITPIDWDQLANNTETAAIVDAYIKWRKLRFKGYDAKQSEAPKPDSIGPGRANPDHIRYLYLSEDSKTPVYEVRPIIGQTVSVARFRVKKDLKIYDLTAEVQDKYGDPEFEWPSLFNSVGRMFSKPYNGQAVEYIPTQYITEKIKNMGFDGIRFGSSLNEGGKNIVLFSDEYCKPFGSDLVTVKGISLDFGEPTIYHLFDDKLIDKKAKASRYTR